MAWPPLTAAGLVAQPPSHADSEHELILYQLLQSEGDDAYGRYNSLLRELVSFEQALDGRLRRRRDSPEG